jgi:hypothetical protein
LSVNYLKNDIFAPLLIHFMEYREIVAVTGLGGLYQLLTTKSDGAIVRNVSDKTTRFISARQHNVTPLESIEVYTTGENVRLHHVFQKMQEHETTVPLADARSADNNAIKTYFKSIFPEFDEERVYVSDMKKMLKWYDILKSNDLLRFEKEAEETESAATGDATVTEQSPAAIVEEKKPAKKETAKKTEETEAGEEKPKKAAKKKKADVEEAVVADEKPAKATAKKKKTEE